jgi:hypothetical protein
LQVKAKGARKITYDAFLKALDHVAAKKVSTTTWDACTRVGTGNRVNRCGTLMFNLQLSCTCRMSPWFTAFQGAILLPRFWG